MDLKKVCIRALSVNFNCVFNFRLVSGATEKAAPLT